MKLPLTTIRRVNDLLGKTGLSQRNIARQCGICHKSVQRIRTKLQDAHIDVAAISDAELAQIFNPAATPAHVQSMVQWSTVHTELQKRDMTKQLLWEEYRLTHPDGISYSAFCKQYRQWCKTMKVSMRQSYRAGEFTFIDFCGRTMPIHNKETGEVWHAQVFVGVLGASSYFFATAVKSQTVADFVDAHVQMFNHFGGVTQYVMTDNLKSAVIKNTKETTELNRVYMELAEHYDFIIMPARPRKPKDKSLAEVGVQIIQRWVLARLRHRTFFSIDELNEQIAYWVNELNQRITKTYPVSRVERFKSIEQQVLQPLPAESYRYSSWSYNVRVDESYHVRFKDRYYSVPYQFAHRLVDVRANVEGVDIFYQREIIARHQISSALTSTDPKHLPEQHRFAQSITPEAILEWAGDIGDATRQFFERNLNDKRHFAKNLKSLIHLKRDVRQKDWLPHLELTCSMMVRMKSFSISRLTVILKRKSTESSPQKRPVIQHPNIRGADYYANLGE